VKNWFGSMWQKARDAVGNVVDKLKQKGRDFISGIRNGITERWESVKTWLAGTGTRAITAIGNVKDVLVQKGKDMMQGFWDGLKNVWNNVKNWAEDLNPFSGAAGAATSAATAFQRDVDSIVRGASVGVPLYSNPTGETHVYNFYGNLEFPNVKNGDDAKSFLDNLSSLAGGEL